MNRLTANDVYGVWDGVTMTWDSKCRFDEDTYAKDIQRAIAARGHGIYATSSNNSLA